VALKKQHRDRELRTRCAGTGENAEPGLEFLKISPVDTEPRDGVVIADCTPNLRQDLWRGLHGK
jgi:hypothetical protein